MESVGSVLASPRPGLGHDAALLQTHQLRSELQALRSLRAEESEVAARARREDLLRLPGQEQGLALSVSELQVSAMWARRPRCSGRRVPGSRPQAGRQPWAHAGRHAGFTSWGRCSVLEGGCLAGLELLSVEEPVGVPVSQPSPEQPAVPLPP